MSIDSVDEEPYLTPVDEMDKGILIQFMNQYKFRCTELEQQLSTRTEELRKEYLSAIDWAGKCQVLEHRLALGREEFQICSDQQDYMAAELDIVDKLLDECEAALLRFTLAKASNGTWNGHKLKGIDKGNRILNIYQEDLDAANNIVIKLRDRKNIDKEGN